MLCASVEEKLVGIPEFWLTILKNVEMLSEMIEVWNNYSRSRNNIPRTTSNVCISLKCFSIDVMWLFDSLQDHDEKILTHLRDIHVTFASVEPFVRIVNDN